MNRVPLISNPERQILKTTRQSNGRNWEECCQQDYPQEDSHWIFSCLQPCFCDRLVARGSRGFRSSYHADISMWLSGHVSCLFRRTGDDTE